jgi:PITH domain
VRSIVLQTSVLSQGPKKIKLLINRPSLGFEDVEEQEEPAVAQVMDIPDNVIREGKHILLRYVRFQNVNSLHVGATFISRISDLTYIGGTDFHSIESRRRRRNPH